MPDSTRNRANHGQRNREIDAIDLSASLEVLPEPADPTFSPLALVGRPVDPDESEPAAQPRPKTQSGTALSSPERSQRRRRNQLDPAIADVRSERDQTRDRLVREALVERGLDPDTLVKKALPRGGKHRPTIELSPDEYAAIQIATAVHPDLFGRTLVSFIRTCAANWETIADVINSDREHDPAARLAGTAIPKGEAAPLNTPRARPGLFSAADAGDVDDGSAVVG